MAGNVKSNKNPQPSQMRITDFAEIKRSWYPIEMLRPNPWNVNVMTAEEFEELKKSIQTTKGEYLKNNPVKIRRTEERDVFEIWDGEHRWQACMEIGYEKIPAELEDIDTEKAKQLNVILSKNRGKIDHFKLSRLLNEEYWINMEEAEKKNWKYRKDLTKTTQTVLASRFGLSGQSELMHILIIYQRLKNIFKNTGTPVFFSNRQLDALARCENDVLRKKLIEHAIKGKWTSKRIRREATKLNKITKYLSNLGENDKVKENILDLLNDEIIFSLMYPELEIKIDEIQDSILNKGKKQFQEELEKANHSRQELEVQNNMRDKELQDLKFKVEMYKQETDWVLASINLAMEFGYSGRGMFEDDQKNRQFYQEWWRSRIRTDLRSYRIKYNQIEHGQTTCDNCKKPIEDLHGDLFMHHNNSARYFPESIAKINNTRILCKRCHLEDANHNS